MKKATLIIILSVCGIGLFAQDTTSYRLRMGLTLFDYPETVDLPYRAPSMRQAVDLGNDFYDLGFWGIDAIGNYLFERAGSNISASDKIYNGLFQYAVGAAFSKYGSELPIPLGVWTHEEFHRSVLGVNGIHAENGNWLLSRWDGTVYGVTDEQLAELKENDLAGLLYSYVAGVQSEALFTSENVVSDVFYNRSFYKNAFYLYNAYYTWNYFHFSASPLSDSVKVIAPDFENADPAERDFAGADLTAWAFDMFKPDSSYYIRDAFPDGEGVNRRVGFSDLSPEAQDYLIKQKNLSLINFINPAIFCINKIKFGESVAFNLFAQYVPTQFGNDISVHLPIQTRMGNYIIAIHNYNNYSNSFWGFDLGLMHKQFFNKKLEGSLVVHGWMQPEEQDFFATSSATGGAAEIAIEFPVLEKFNAFASGSFKTDGWMIGVPYLEQTMNFKLGLKYNLPAN